MRIKGSELRRIIKEEISRSLIREQDSGLSSPASDTVPSSDVAVLLSGRTFYSSKFSLDYESAEYRSVDFEKFARESGLYNNLKIDYYNKTYTVTCDVKIPLTVTPGSEKEAKTARRYFQNVESGKAIPDLVLFPERGHTTIDLSFVRGVFSDYFVTGEMPATISLPKPVSPGSYIVEGTLVIVCKENKGVFTLFAELNMPLVMDDYISSSP